jgi:putative ABC transport system substrate-binding protein
MLQHGLRDHGYIDGRNISIEYRFAEGKAERLPDLAADLVRLKPDVLFVIGGDVAPFVSKATQTIPIVFVMSADPLKLGLVATLARPGGNATGFTFLQDELASKRLELLKEVAPRISRVAFLSNPDHPDNELRVAQRAATTLGVHLEPIEMRGPGDLDGALQAITKASIDALYVVASRQTVASLPRIVDFATKKDSIGRRLGCMGAGWRIALLRSKRWRSCSQRRHLRGQNFQRRQARRSSDTAADALRAASQSAKRQGSRPLDPRIFSAAGRQGD